MVEETDEGVACNLGMPWIPRSSERSLDTVRGAMASRVGMGQSRAGRQASGDCAEHGEEGGVGHHGRRGPVRGGPPWPPGLCEGKRVGRQKLNLGSTCQ